MALDYLMAGILIISLIFFSLNLIIPTVHVSLQHIHEQQLQPFTERVFDKILLSTGLPGNWGSDFTVDENSLEGFGLSSNLELGNLTEFYLLDADKVQRIVNEVDNLYYIPTSTISSLLGLTFQDDSGNEHLKYGFRLRIVPALNITITVLGTYQIKGVEKPCYFNVTVKNYEGKPAPNADVTGIYLVGFAKKQGQDESADYFSGVLTNKTDWRGMCTLNFHEIIDEINIKAPGQFKKVGIYLLIYADYFGLKSFSTWYQADDVLDALVIGDKLVITFPVEKVLPNSARFLKGAIGIRDKAPYVTVIPMDEDKIIINKGGKNYYVYNLTRLDPSINTIAIMASVAVGQGQGRIYRFIASPYPRTVDYISTSTPSTGMKIAVLKRIVRIGEFTYYSELSLWRIAE